MQVTGCIPKPGIEVFCPRSPGNIGQLALMDAVKDFDCND